MEKGISNIWDANQAAFKDHWGYSEPTEDMYKVWQEEKRWFQPQLWKIAWDGGEVAGQVGNYVDEVENKTLNRKRAYTEEISVGRKWRKRGLAKALIAESIRMFQEMGKFTETTLGVDADNPRAGDLGECVRGVIASPLQITYWPLMTVSGGDRVTSLQYSASSSC